MAKWSRRLLFEIVRVACGMSLAASAVAGDMFLMGDRVGYGIARSHEQTCFAIAPSSVVFESVTVHAVLPGIFRLPVEVMRTFDEGFAIVRIGETATACANASWTEGERLVVALERTGIGSLELRLGDGSVGSMHVRIGEIAANGFFSISPVIDSERLMQGMSGSRVLLEGRAAGVLLSVDEMQNLGRVIRQDTLSALVAPFFDSFVGNTADTEERVAIDTPREPQPQQRLQPQPTVATQPEPSFPELAQPIPLAQSSPSVQPLPQVLHRFFIGKQTWRNNLKVIGDRLFVGSSGLEWNTSDPLDGIYSFDLITGKQIWFVHTDGDANGLLYSRGLVIAGTDSGVVLGIGARSGKTYWNRQFEGKVYAPPVSIPTGVAIATSTGELNVLNVKDGVTRASSRLDAGVRAGLVAAKHSLWVATETGTLYRYAGFGDVQIRRQSRIYYPDALGKNLSGIAIDWYDRLGQGRGRRARIYSAPLVLGDRVIVSVVRQGQYEYPPVMAFSSDGSLDWIGTDPDGYINSVFGDSRGAPAFWKDQLILVEPNSNSVYALSIDSGEVLWATSLGSSTPQQWASPVVENDYVYIARHDGFLHKLQASNGNRIWSMNIGQLAQSGEVFLKNESLPGTGSVPASSSLLMNPIFATPAVSGSTIVVGTNEGYVYVIQDSP